MERKIAVLACAMLLSGSVSTFGQVYENRDAEGNPVFSDSPSQGAIEVPIPDTNVSGAVKETPVPDDARSDGDAPGPQSQSSEGVNKDRSKVVVIGEDDDTQRGNEFIDNEGRREVLDAERPVEVLDAESRREVR